MIFHMSLIGFKQYNFLVAIINLQFYIHFNEHSRPFITVGPRF